MGEDEGCGRSPIVLNKENLKLSSGWWGFEQGVNFVSFNLSEGVPKNKMLEFVSRSKMNTNSPKI